MFDSIRNHKKYLMGFLMILIIPSFVLFGIEGYTRFNESGQPVATVDGKEITKAEWDQAHQQESQRLREAMPTLDARLLDSDGARYATLERLVRQRLLSAAASKLNLYTSDARLARDLQQNEAIAALRKADGSLDVEAYRQLVSRQGMTPEMFEARVRADLSQRQVSQGILGSGFAPTALASISLNAFFERREVRVARFAAGEFAAQVKPADADVEGFYNANQALFQAPEQAEIEYLVLDAAALQGSVALNEADVRAYYDQNASRLSGTEERRARHILLTVPAGASAADKDAVRQRAETLLAQVRAKPASFAEVAKAQSQDPGSAANGGDLDYFGRGAMVKPFEDVVFSLKKDAISDLVETEFGFHIIQLTDVKAPPVRSFESMRAEIEADLKKQQAQKQFAEAADTFSNLVYEQPDTLKPAADRLKLQIRKATVQRQPQAGVSGVLANERLLGALFDTESLDKKRNTEAIDTGSGQLVSARVINHTAAHTRPLAEVRDEVRRRLVATRSAELARAEGEKQLQAAKSGADVKGLGAATAVSRENAQGLALPVLTAALSADSKALPAWVGVNLGDQGYVVVKVEKVLPRDVRPAQALSQEVQQYSQWWASAENEAYVETLKERFKVRILVPEPAAASPAR
ncbi:MAG: SurA N-terminal domain-containing protein [Hydrogenophaga sp.]|jgi:peptidyl-prolyl cis-trans isomerase D|uniref:SurA N-terminal domain-containing protein n=1 Tax=Hydrogenophaga sp. TaxID=1904254 RepID=UPI001DA5A1C3|nr:SurA N-terminal domain-containing protein [Hydrogenophaga sp.]MBW0170179.1 SurA N-terminal domain-containing protein [Hydrogenophaga sp.]MBW0184424.1 SurA N-terminal domain-containing protein [Hydrogenophaga sp.]